MTGEHDAAKRISATVAKHIRHGNLPESTMTKHRHHHKPDAPAHVCIQGDVHTLVTGAGSHVTLQVTYGSDEAPARAQQRDEAPEDAEVVPVRRGNMHNS
jgi:hypothetical protein